jgi:hypothetical protein
MSEPDFAADKVQKINCPACDGMSCEQCEGYGYVFMVPNDMDPLEARRQVEAIMLGIDNGTD